jgi:hypothetical protein
MIFNTLLFPAFHVGQLIIVPILNGIEARFWHFLFQINQLTTEKEKIRLILLLHGKNLVIFQKAIG